MHLPAALATAAALASLTCLAPQAGARPSAPAEEMRAMWVVRFSLSSPARIRQAVAAADAHNFNALFVQVRGRGDAWYASDLEPRAEALTGQPADFDPLALIIREAHARGIKVHAWLNTYLTWSGPQPPRSSRHLFRARPEWMARDRSGKYSARPTKTSEGAFVQPSHPDVQDHLYRVFMDVARRYDVDGIHFDYVRYPGADYDFSPAALKRFRDWMAPRTTASGWAAVRADGGRFAWVHTFPKEWAEWRRMQVTGLVRRIAQGAHAAKPWLAVTAAVFANAEDAYRDKGQDWRAWLANGVVDGVCPMAYSRDPETVSAQIAEAVRAAGGRHVYAGLGSYRVSASTTASMIARSRELGANGFSLFSYGDITDEGKRLDYLSKLSRGTLSSRAAPPRMHWRTERKAAP